MLREHKEMFVKQTKKGCIQELLGCEATNEFKIFPNKDAASQPERQNMYSLEESSFLCRLCCANNRSFTQEIWTGTKEALGPSILKMERPFANPLTPCCCCNFPPLMQTMNFSDSTGPLGMVSIPCFICLPSLKVEDQSGKHEYNVSMPSCMGGICVDCMAEGCCNCKIPFYIFKPGVPLVRGQESGKIIKLWRGLGTEVFTDAASFQVDFPEDAEPASKARLLGTTMFINIQFFEKGNE